MRMTEVRAKAKAVGIDPARMKKAELICAIQRSEGFTPCFGSNWTECPYTDCCFRSDCLGEKERPLEV